MREFQESADCHKNELTDLASLISELWRHGQSHPNWSAPPRAPSVTADDYVETLVEELQKIWMS